MDGEVRNNRADRRYELAVDGALAIAEYRLRDGRITFTHTEVPDALEGRGIGTVWSRRRWTTPAPRGSRWCPSARS